MAASGRLLKVVIKVRFSFSSVDFFLYGSPAIVCCEPIDCTIDWWMKNNLKERVIGGFTCENRRNIWGKSIRQN